MMHRKNSLSIFIIKEPQNKNQYKEMCYLDIIHLCVPFSSFSEASSMGKAIYIYVYIYMLFLTRNNFLVNFIDFDWSLKRHKMFPFILSSPNKSIKTTCDDVFD